MTYDEPLVLVDITVHAAVFSILSVYRQMSSIRTKRNTGGIGYVVD